MIMVATPSKIIKPSEPQTINNNFLFIMIGVTIPGSSTFAIRSESVFVLSFSLGSTLVEITGTKGLSSVCLLVSSTTSSVFFSSAG